MADTVTLEEVEILASKLTPADQNRLVDKLLRDLRGSSPPEEHTWENLRGIAPNLLQGEDAQDWVSRTRRESDEHRDSQLRFHP